MSRQEALLARLGSSSRFSDPIIWCEMVAIKLLLVASATCSGLVAAMPDPAAAARLDQRAINCAQVTGALSALRKLGAPATAFCSSFLQIPATKTLTTTVTPPTVSVRTMLVSMMRV